MNDVTRPTRMEIDLNNLKHNVDKIKEYVGENVNIMPVIKANGYGTYINKRLDFLNMFDIVAVALVDEAIELRQIGYQKDIFVLNQPYIDEIDKIINNNISIGLSSDSFLEEVIKRNLSMKVHIEIGTGMGRTGINPSRVEEYANKIINESNIKIEGIYTHLSSADSDDEYTNKQLESFDKSVNKLKEIIRDIKYIHASASNGILNYKNSYYNLVRPGIILYGYESFDGASKLIDIKPIAKLKSKITYLKELPANFSIGYSRSYITNKETKVATIPIGYADGLKRILSNKGYVVINKKKVAIIGNICMDGFMADVTDIENVKVGDDVYIFDNEIQTLDEISNESGTINYEFLSTISNRVPRVFLGEYNDRR